MGDSKAIVAVLVAAAMFVPTAMGALVDHREAAADGADRLLENQFEDGAFPWIVGNDGKYQNVQGVTAQGLLDAYRATANETYLEAAGDNAAWLADYMADNPGEYSSAPNVYFLAEYALLSQNLDDLELARQAFDNAIQDERWEDNPTALAEHILQSRVNQGHTNLGLWDVGLFVRAAQDIGHTDAADEIAAVLVEQAEEQTIVDPFDETATHYEIGLAGLLFGLAEADVVGHQEILDKAAAALADEQGEDGSIPGDIYGDVQTTAYAALGFIAIGDLAPALDACDWLVDAQEDDGAWLAGGTEYAETNSEAVQALATCTLPARNGAQAYSDAAVAFVPP